MKEIKKGLLLTFTGGKTKYRITSTKPDYFDAIRVTSGTKAMWQPIAIRVKVYADGTVSVMNLNNKKIVKKQGFSTRKPTESEIKGYLENKKNYKNMEPLESWISNRKFT